MQDCWWLRGGMASGVGAGLVLGLCSFGQVSICNAQFVEGGLPAEEPDATAIRYTVNQLIVLDALDALVTSLERFDGASAVREKEPACKPTLRS